MSELPLSLSLLHCLDQAHTLQSSFSRTSSFSAYPWYLRQVDARGTVRRSPRCPALVSNSTGSIWDLSQPLNMYTHGPHTYTSQGLGYLRAFLLFPYDNIYWVRFNVWEDVCNPDTMGAKSWPSLQIKSHSKKPNLSSFLENFNIQPNFSHTHTKSKEPNS